MTSEYPLYLGSRNFGRNEVLGASESAISFKMNKKSGYIPLLSVLPVMEINTTNFFSFENFGYYRGNYKDTARFNNIYSSTPIRRRRNVKVSNVMFSVFGQKRVSESFVSKPNIFDYSTRPEGVNLFNPNPTDIITLALIKISDFNSIQKSSMYITIDLSKVLILMSKTKFKSPKYMAENYNRSLRSYFVKNYNDLRRDYGLQVEIVDDNVIKEYYVDNLSASTSSLFELPKIDEEIKDDVFSNIKEHLVC